MNNQLLTDAKTFPHLFRWNGPLPSQELLVWVQKQSWSIPKDLMDFWALTGGGEVFETEEFLKPVLPESERGVESVTGWYQHHGMSSGLVLFHAGLGITAVRCVDAT